MTDYRSFIEGLRRTPHEWLRKEIDEVLKKGRVIRFLCGACETDYELKLRRGDLQMCECPECGNVSLQMIRG